MARGSMKARMARVRSFRKSNPRRRQKARRNPWPIAGMTATPNPRRRRARRNPVRGAVRRYRARRAARREGRSVNILGINLPPLETVLYTGVGIIGTPMVEGFASRFLPVDLTANTVGRYALKVASVLGLVWIGKTILGPNEAKAIGAGGGAYVLVSALREFVPGLVGMGSYTPMAAYSQMRGGAGMQGALPRNFSPANSAQAQPRFLERGY